MSKMDSFGIQGDSGMEGESDLAIRLFGTMEVTARRGSVHLPSRRAAWLLAFLALRRGTPIERQALAGTLWPDSTDAGSLHNLRQTLAGVRRALGSAGERIRTVSPHSILLEPGSGLWVDASEFDDALRDGGLGALERAASLYRGPLLPHCDEPFALIEREAKEGAFLDLAERLGERYSSDQDYAKATRLYRRAISVDPYRESAARGLMACLARSGEAAAALDVYRRLAQSLRRDLRSEPDPETKALVRSVKSEIEKPRRAQEVDAPIARRPPRPLTALIGRESQVEEIVALTDRNRLVTLTGVGGVGKTRLALAVAERIEEKSLDRFAFVDLVSVHDSETIPSAIANALGVPENARRPTVEVLSDRLRDHHGLIVIDNCEHLVEGVAEALRTLLAHALHVQVLATSRQPLGVSGERVWRAPSLAVPAPDSPPEESLRSTSVRLFLERATSFGGVDPWGSDEIETIGSICRRLDGIPLAIELAAARTNLLSVQEIEARLGDRFSLLGGGARSVPRHETLRATMDWSWDLLTNAERNLLARLSVFRGGATLRAIEAIACLPRLDLLSSLVDRSLVLVDREADGSRFTMLETVRQYASERLEETGEGNDARVHHGDFYSLWAQEVTEHFYAADEASWFGRLEKDHDNLRAALEWHRSQRQSEAELRLAVCLSRFWDTHGHLSEGRGVLERALRAAPPDLPQGLVAEAHGHAGWMATVQRDCETARDHYERALGYFRQAGDRRRMAIGLNCLAATNYYAEDYPTARVQYAEALTLYRQLGMVAGAATVLANQGEMALRTDDLATARICLERSLVEGGGPETGHPEWRALTLSSLSLTDLRQGRREEARDHAVESLRSFVEAQSFVSMPQALGLLAIVEGAFEAWDRAARLLGAEQSLASSQGVPLFSLAESERERTAADAFRALGPEPFEAAFGRGRRLSLNDAVALALDE